jgi:SAM-dependent methyltransferase
MELPLSPNKVFKCPFTHRGLVPLSDRELARINQKVANKELCFYSGVPVNFELTSAYRSYNYLHIYPVYCGVVFLTKGTTIVPKNRVAQPFHKVHKADIEEFYAQYGLERSLPYMMSDEKRMSAGTKLSVAEKLPKEGKVLISANAQSADDVLNLSYGLNFKYHIHVDQHIGRLNALIDELPSAILTVLADTSVLPFSDRSVDAIVDLANEEYVEHEAQVSYYQEVKRALKGTGVLVKCLNAQDAQKFKKLFQSDKLMAKAKSIVAPWTNSSLPNMYFIEEDQVAKSVTEDLAVKKGEFSGQLG